MVWCSLAVGLLTVSNALAVPLPVDEMNLRPLLMDTEDQGLLPWTPKTSRDAVSIWNGDVSETGEYPEVAALGILDNSGWGDSFCSGTLINESWLLTAAHCVDDLGWYLNQGYEIYVFWGVRPFQGQLEDAIPARQWIPHPDYQSNSFTSDVGLVELEWPKPAADIMVVNDDDFTDDLLGIEASFVGYGITLPDAHDGGVQRHTTIPVFAYDNQVLYSYNGTYDLFGYPVFNGTSNICSGDSGGAMLVDLDGWQIVGVNSFGVGSCEGGYSGAMRVDVFLDWIEGYTKVYRDADEIPVHSIGQPGADPRDEFTADAALSDAGGWGDPVTPSGENAFSATFLGASCATTPATGSKSTLVWALLMVLSWVFWRAKDQKMNDGPLFFYGMFR